MSHAGKAAAVAAPAPAKTAPVSSPAETAERAAEELAQRALRGERIPATLAIAHRLDRTRIHRQAEEAATPAPAGAPGGGLLVEDDQTPAAGQMRKTAFLDELYAALCRTVERGFEGTPYEGRGCPFLEQSIAAYRDRPAADAEAALRRWAGESAGASTASGYIPVVEGRVRRSVQVYVATGEITGVPPDLLPLVPGLGGGFLAGVMTGGLLGGIGRAIGTGLSRLLFKERPGATAPPADPATVRSRLGSGHTLDSRVQARMESAFGSSFSHVRIHDDETSVRLAESLEARAFTIGNDVAFAGGEYLPGTLVGDALIAHELAHVVQQGPGAAGAPAPALEADADEAAAEAVVDDEDALARRSKRARPRRRTGLQLLRCAGTQQTGPAAATAPGRTWAPRARRQPVPGAAEIDNAQWLRDLEAAEATQDEAQRGQLMFVMVERALAGIGLQARLSTTNSPRVSADDYAEAPVINFDMNLNRKLTAVGVEPEESLEPNAGNSFRSPDGRRRFAVIGPKVFRGEEDRSTPRSRARGPRFRWDPTPNSVRMVAEHELLHVERHLGVEGRESEQELEAYTLDFVNYFHLSGRRFNVTRDMYLGKSWTRLLTYYDRRTTRQAAKDRTFNMLVDYYNSPPGDPAVTRAVFQGWLENRAGEGWTLITRLAQALNIPLPEGGSR